MKEKRIDFRPIENGVKVRILKGQLVIKVIRLSPHRAREALESLEEALDEGDSP